MADLACVPGQVDLIGMEAGVRPPGKPDKAAQESARAAAETMQVQQSPLPPPEPTTVACAVHFFVSNLLHTSCLGLHLSGCIYTSAV